MLAGYKLDPEAYEELIASMAAYDMREEGLGLAFLDEFRTVAQRATRFPESGAIVPGSPVEVPIRRFLFKGFKHAVYTLKLDGRLLIFAIAHQHQRPGYWLRRLMR